METIRKYRARIGSEGAPIITVMADGIFEAQKEVRKELSKNPSRRRFLERWKEAGEYVEIVKD